MIGLFERFCRSWVENALPEPTVARRRLLSFSAEQLRALLSRSRIYPPGIWSASDDALRGVVLRAYDAGQINDEDIEDIS